MRVFAGVVAVAMLAGCQQAAELKVDKAWIRLPAVQGQPGAAYFTVHGGGEGDTLLAVTTPAALRTEMHESMKGDRGVMTMHALGDVAIPARGTLAFAPGGRHVMLFSIGPAVKPGDKVPLALAFAGGKRIEVEAQVVGAGDPPPQQ